MLMLQADEHTFYFGRPPSRMQQQQQQQQQQQPGLGQANPWPHGVAVRSTASATQAGFAVTEAASVNALESLLGMLGEQAQQEAAAATPGSSVRQPEAAAAAGQDVGPLSQLHPWVVHQAFQRVTGWVLDEGANAGTDPAAVRRVLCLLLQHCMCDTPCDSDISSQQPHETPPTPVAQPQEGKPDQGQQHGPLSGYSIDLVGSVLWCTGSVVGAYGWRCGPRVVAAVRQWLARRAEVVLAADEAAGAVDMAAVVSVLWGYAALLHSAAAGDSGSSIVCGSSGGGSSTNASADAAATAAAATVVIDLDEVPLVQGPGAAAAAAIAAAAAAPDISSTGRALDALALSTVRLLEASYGSNGNNHVDAVDLADLAWALSVIGHRSPATAQLAEAVAHEVYRTVSNRYSMQAPFSPRDLVKVAQSYARLGLTDGSVSRMYDAVAGHVAKRIRSRHMHALTRPTDCAALLQAYADGGHRSVVVPELLAACALQISREVADHAESLARANASASTSTGTGYNDSNGTSSSSSSRGRGSALRQAVPHVPLWRRSSSVDTATTAAVAAWSSVLDAQQAVTVLRCFARMGPYDPGAALRASLLLAVTPQLPGLPHGVRQSTAAELLELLAGVQSAPPGPQALAALADAALRAAPHTLDAGVSTPGSAAAAVGRLRALWSLLALGWTGKDEGNVIDQVLRGVLCCDDDRGATPPPLSTRDAGRVMGVLCMLRVHADGATCTGSYGNDYCWLTPIQRFGLACVQLREALAAAPPSVLPHWGSGGGGSADAWALRRAERERDAENALHAAGIAMEALGEEGREMAEQVFPPAVYRRLCLAAADAAGAG